MLCKIVDTTLRDGEQRGGNGLSFKEKVEMAVKIDKLSIHQIEAGTPAMGGEEKRSIIKIVESNLRSKISAWNRLSIEDIKHSIDCGVDIIHFAVPSSELQINTKLKKDVPWVISNLQKCIYYVRENGFEASVGLEDASRGDESFILDLIEICKNEGVSRIRYADTVGILTPKKTFDTIKLIKRYCNIELEFHAHNDFGMAVANSIAAAKAGVEYVDCTLNGVGERAGNCDYFQFIKASNSMDMI
jgi:homocitrate synthase NifV